MHIHAIADMPLAAALSYIARRWHVFPLRPCAKTPITPHGYIDATDDEETIRAWWREHPRAGIGIACRASGLIVIDIDPRHGGDGTLATLELELDRARTSLGPGVDVKLHGYIVAAPSVHPSGQRYEWLRIEPIAELPRPWIDRIAIRRERAPTTTRTSRARGCGSTPYGLAALESECSSVRDAKEGERNNRLYHAALVLGQLEAGGELERGDIDGALPSAASACGLPDREARRTIESGLRAGRLTPRRAPRSAPRPPVVLGPDEEPPPWEPPDDALHPDAPWAESLAYRTTADGDRVLQATAGNLALLLTHSDEWSGTLCYDLLEHTAAWSRSPPPLIGMTPPSGRLEEHHADYVRHWMLLHHGVQWSRDAALAGCQMAAMERRRHPVQAYLESLVWDGEQRVAQWLERYLGSCEPGPVGMWWIISAVARAMRPGCQVDHVLILEGQQGTGKSTALRILAGEWYQGALGDLRDKDAVQSLLGAWIVEISELEALRGQAVSRIKEFITQTEDRYRPSYGRATVVRPRTCVFAGTTNDASYLYDPTGARRFWPVAVSRLDAAALERDRDQIWAEALTLYRAGARWWPAQDDADWLADIADARTVRDPWESIIAQRIDERVSWSTREILDDILRLEPHQMDHRAAVRVSAICRRLGLQRAREMVDGARGRRWRRRPG